MLKFAKGHKKGVETMMKHNLIKIMFAMLIVLFLTACSNRVWSRNNTLYFNEPEVVHSIRVSPRRSTNRLQVTEEKMLNHYFPILRKI